MSEQDVPLLRRQCRRDRSALLLAGWSQIEVEHERILPASACEVECTMVSSAQAVLDVGKL